MFGFSRSVVIYHAVDIGKQLFSTVVIGKKFKEEEISTTLTQMLTDSFKSGEYCLYEQEAELRTTLYPLKNAEGQTMAIIAIEDLVFDLQLHEIIIMLLQIYQNFQFQFQISH